MVYWISFESKHGKSKFPVNNVNLANCSYEYYQTAGDTLIYIGNRLSYKLRNGLCIYKTVELESTFLELTNTKKSDVIIDAIYRDPSMNLDGFNNIYLNPLLDKTSKESKSVFLFGDFNVDLL